MSLADRLTHTPRLAFRAFLLITCCLAGIFWLNGQIPGVVSTDAVAAKVSDISKSSKIRVEFDSEGPGDYCPEYSTDGGDVWTPIHNFSHHYYDGLNVCYIEIPDPAPNDLMLRVVEIEAELRPTIFPQHPTACPSHTERSPSTNI